MTDESHKTEASSFAKESKLRSTTLSGLTRGSVRVESENPDFEEALRGVANSRLNRMLDQFGEQLSEFSVDYAVEDLIRTKNIALTKAIQEKIEAQKKEQHHKKFQESEAQRRHKIIVDLREQLAASEAELEKLKIQISSERRQYDWQREYARSFRYLLKTTLIRILEKLRLRQKP